MSYEPTLIISRDDLRNRSCLIEEAEFKKHPKKMNERMVRRKEANTALYFALPLEGFKIKDNWLVIIRPEGTIHNAAVRELLMDLEIEYAIDY